MHSSRDGRLDRPPNMQSDIDQSNGCTKLGLMLVSWMGNQTGFQKASRMVKVTVAVLDYNLLYHGLHYTLLDNIVDNCLRQRAKNHNLTDRSQCTMDAA
mmetsp:Transcript_31323/g.75416  ORF Transcript_31323/g.75416 Transcript_31323/m.75416 type:complete len:99 (+) Transcript_31323:3249-3545(+)